MSIIPFQSGDYRGACDGTWALDPAVVASLGRVRGWIEAAQEITSLGRHALARHTLMVHGEPVVLAIKSFSRGSRFRDRSFEKNGSKAERSFIAAVRLTEQGVGTPRPFAYLDRWESGRLLESYYLCAYQDQITSFRDELNRLYRDDPLCRRIMTLMETAALAIADMHDAGVCHRDLGNQNILLRRTGDDSWGDVQFIDLNRAHLSDRLTLKQRARDISRIDLPSDFLRVFKCMYLRHQHPTAEFQKWENHFRRRFALHTASRKYRHPIREARQRKKDAQFPLVPRGRELWVWDDRSMQAVSTMLRKERHAYYPAANHFFVAKGLFKAVAPVWRLYRACLAESFTRRVSIAGRIGMAAGAGEAEELAGLGRIPALVRFCRHEKDEVNARTLAAARHFKEQGHAVFAALIQDRTAIREPDRWEAFVEKWVPELRGVADGIEVGHAINRVKWGVWDIREYRALLDPVMRCAASAGAIPLCGPSVIDFEYHCLAGLLDQIPPGGLDALSLHLYVDRRGAPENRQGRFSAVEKFALARAMANWSPAIKGDRVIVSEVNWPILGTGEYSPVNSPYIIPGSHTNDPSVDEESYANYMVRYYALALCSGFVDQVFWWRLVARGFGLVDDTLPEWRPRPAYRALQALVRELGQATYIERLKAGAGVWAFRFERAGGDHAVLAWSHPGPARLPPMFSWEAMLSRDGQELSGRTGEVTLSGSPVYFVGVR